MDSPAAERSDASLRDDRPASRRMHEPSVTTRALLPELPLLRMQNFIAIAEHQCGPADSATVFPEPG
jgi:hypothetical protein